MTIDITQIVVTLIGVVVMILGVVITRVVVPWVKANTSETTQDIIEAVTEAAVLAAQQLYSSGCAAVKKDYAVDYVTTVLATYGIEINEDVISSAIESALKALKISAGDAWV